MIATMSDRKDRREIVGIVGPNYYTSGTNVMSPKALGLKDWEDLRGKPVCGKQGAFYNQIVNRALWRQDHRLHRQRRGQAGAARQEVHRLGLRRLVDHVGPVFGQLGRLRNAAGLRGRQPLGPGRAAGRADCIFGNFMSGMTYNWHQSGKLIELEKKWGIQPTQYLKNQQERFADWLAD